MTPCTNPIPGSYVEDPIALQRIANFQTLKLPLLSSWIKIYQGNPSADNETPGFSYTIGQFSLLTGIVSATPEVSGFRVYFASYKKDGSAMDSYVPARKQDHMTLIFAPTKLNADGFNQDNTGQFYILDPSGRYVNPINITAYVTSGIQNFSWITHYVTNKVPLLSNVSINPPINGETQSVWFDVRAITDWNNEIACWQINGRTITVIQFALAAFSKDEIAKYKGNTYNVDYQLTLIVTIEPDDANSADTLFPYYFNMESFKVFKERLALAIAGDKYDTGVPCPPAICG